jgi:transposase-like protein
MVVIVAADRSTRAVPAGARSPSRRPQSSAVYRWPADVILTAVRWYLAYPLSSRQVLELLAERGIDVSHRTILDWVQAFGPRLAAEVRRRRRPVGGRWFVDEVFLFRKGQKRYLYRAIDEDGVVVDVLLRERRDTASAEAFFRQAIERTGVIPDEVVTDHHRPYIKVVATICPGAQHVRTGLHRARGENTKAVERSHVPTRDRLRNSRGLKRTDTSLERRGVLRPNSAIRGPKSRSDGAPVHLSR